MVEKNNVGIPDVNKQTENFEPTGYCQVPSFSKGMEQYLNEQGMTPALWNIMSEDDQKSYYLNYCDIMSAKARAFGWYGYD